MSNNGKEPWARVETFVNKSGGMITKFSKIDAVSECEFEGTGQVIDAISKATSTAAFPIRAENIHEAIEKFERNRNVAERKFCEENLKAGIKPDSGLVIPDLIGLPDIKRGKV